MPTLPTAVISLSAAYGGAYNIHVNPTLIPIIYLEFDDPRGIHGDIHPIWPNIHISITIYTFGVESMLLEYAGQICLKVQL